jgi:hypothetical protein
MKKIFAILALLFSLNLGHATLYQEAAQEGEVSKPTQRYRLSAEGPEPECPWQKSGLSDPEATHCWSCAEDIIFTIPVDQGIRSILFENVTVLGKQNITVYLDGDYFREVCIFPRNYKQSLFVPCLFHDDVTQPVVVKLHIPGARQPDNGDTRKLGMAFRTVALFDADLPILALQEAKNPFSEDQRDRLATNVRWTVVHETFPVEQVGQLRTLLAEIQSDLQAFAVTHECDVTDIWHDPRNVLAYLQNSTAVLCKTQRFVGDLQGEWNTADEYNVQPHVIGSMLWSVFTESLRDSSENLAAHTIGTLHVQLQQLIAQAEAKRAEMYKQQIRDMADHGEEVAKQVALDFFNLELQRKEIRSLIRAGELPSEFMTEQRRQVWKRGQELDDILSHLIKVPTPESIYESLCAEQCPIGLKFLRVEALAKEIVEFEK